MSELLRTPADGIGYAARVARAAAKGIAAHSWTRERAGAIAALNGLAEMLEPFAGSPSAPPSDPVSPPPMPSPNWPLSEGTAVEFAIGVASEMMSLVPLRYAESVALGYTGDSCPTCGNFTMVRNGACLKCETCGATTGCS